MQNSSSRKYEHRKKTRERSLKRRKAKPSDLWTPKNDPLDLENPESRLAKTNIKNILTEQVFRTLPLADQSKLVQLLPTCDRFLQPDSNLSVGPEALNNEFFAKACIEWKDRLADGDFTAETQVRCKLEREKRLHVDPWKKKYFESFWGEKLTTSTTTSMTISSPILATSVQPSSSSSLPEKRPLLADLLTKVVPSPHSTSSSSISISSQQVREQLTLMLNNKSLQPLKAFGKAGAVASATVTTTMVAPTPTVLPNRTFQTSVVNSGPGRVQICLAKSYVTSASGQPSNSAARPTMGGAARPTTGGAPMLGKRTLSNEDRSSSRPAKKSLIACKDILSRSPDGSFGAKSDGSNPKSESAASLMPVLASALLTTDNVSSSTASLSSSCIPTVVLMHKQSSGMASQSLTLSSSSSSSSKNQVVGLSHILRSDALKPTVAKETNVSVSASARGGAASVRDELAFKLEAQSNRVKKNLFTTSDDSSSKHQENFQKHIENLAVLISEKEKQGKAATVGNPVVLPSSGSLSVSSHLLSSSLLNSLIMSNASFLSASAPGPSSISSIVMAPPSLLQQQPQRLAVSSGSRDAFQVQDVSVNAASAVPKCFLASQGETVYIVQQGSSAPAIAKPQPPAIAFPNQTPLILVLGNHPSLPPGMALASGQLPQQASLAPPKLAINSQSLEFAFANQGGSAAPMVATQPSQQTLIPSQTLLVGNKAVNHAFQTFTFASQAPQNFTVTSQTANKTLVVGSMPTVTLANRAASSLNCGGNAGPPRTFTVFNHAFQKLESVSPAGISETAIPRRPLSSASVGLSTPRPMFIGNPAGERFVLANLSANQASQLLNVNAHLKDGGVGAMSSLGTYNPPPLENQSVAANQLPHQLLVAISGASPQMLCAAAKNSINQLPVLGQLSFRAASTPPKIGPGSVCVLRRPSPTENLPAVSPLPSSVRCCSILPSPGGVQSTSTPLILLSKAVAPPPPPPSENLVSLSIPGAIPSFSSTPRSSTLITSPHQHQPFMFQVLPENNVHTVVDSQNYPQRIILNTASLNGGLELKTFDGREQANADILRSLCCTAAAPSAIPESNCNPTADQVLGRSMQLLNGSRVKTITIKKLTQPVVHAPAASSTVTAQQQSSGSLIKTLLTNRDPLPEQLLFLSPDNHDILNSIFRVGQNSVVTDSTMMREMQRDGGASTGAEICKSCGTVLDRRSGGVAEAWNSIGICVACHSSV